ncbi:alpha/beta hydrolase [bacterium]|nr:MAG: alpha/beta hydrolase [bacterium]
MVHRSFGAPCVEENSDPESLGFAFRQAWLPTARSKRLFAWLLPAGHPAATVVMMHGWGGNAEFLLPLAGPFLAVGLNVLLVDARNHGRSDHDGHSSLPRFADDLGNAVDWVRQQTEHAGPVALCGHSLGGGAALLCAAEREDIAAVISLATFAHPTDMMRRFMRKARIPDLLVPLVLRYVERVIGRRYDDIAPINTICRVTCPVLVMHGSSDRTVPHGDMEAMRRKCQGHPPEFVAIPGAGHSSVKRFMEHEGALVDFLKRAGF